MPDESNFQNGFCPFCDPAATSATRLYEGKDFFIAADFAPVADAHLLLIPRCHYPHLASIPAELDEEFHLLKARMGDFVRRFFGPLTFWENGIFGQSVPHAHLHALAARLDTSLFAEHGLEFADMEGLRREHGRAESRYVWLEHDGVRRILPPQPELYSRIIRHAREHNGGLWRYSPPERRLHGRSAIEQMLRLWREYSAEPPPPK